MQEPSNEEKIKVGLQKYLEQIETYPPLSPEEEIVLAQKIREGDQFALEKLTKSNLRFVVSVAKQYLNQGLELNELINEGNLGLIQAAQKFDETRGFKFVSYAVWWIRQSIIQALSEHNRLSKLPLYEITHIEDVIDDAKISEALGKLLNESLNAGPTMNLIFDLAEFDTTEIGEIILMLSELYRSVGGDNLEIKKVDSFEFITEFQPELL